MESWFPALQACGSYNNRFDLTAEVNQIVALESSMKAGQIRLHSIFLSSLSKLAPDLQKLYGFDKTIAESELKSLALTGLGTYLEIANPEQISFLSFGWSPLP